MAQRTVEEVEGEVGLDPSVQDRSGSSGCGYNPDKDDNPANDCNQPSRWHIRCRGDNPEQFHGMLACDLHLCRILGGIYAETVIGQHEVGSACGLENTWWIEQPDECGSFCVTVELGVELGLLRYVD